MKLTAKRVARLLKKPGRYHDGHGLYLQVANPNNVSWLLRYERLGRERWAGLGPLHIISLSVARERANAMRLQLLDGIDPLDAKRAAKATAKLSAARKLTFEQAAKQYHKQHESKWRSSQHAGQWLRSLEVYAFPVIGGQDVAIVETPDILRVIESLWSTKAVTMDRVRNRIESVIDWAVVRKHRPAGTNPARWTGHLDQVLPAVKEIAKPVHHPALPYVELPAFMQALRQQHSIAARALQFLILTSARSSEALDAVWSEIDLDNAMWTIPAHRMKAGKEHRVSLSGPVVELLRNLPREDGNPHLFIGGRAGGCVSNASVRRLLRSLRDGDITIHGFRSTFSDWAHEQTAHASHTIEISLAHAVGNEAEQTYRRGPMIAKRAKLMADWAKFTTSTPVVIKGDNVVTMHGGR
jgi:integrase